MPVFFKKKVNKSICAPIKGRCIDITNVSDNVFSTKMLGDGFAVIPEEETICSPVDGLIIMLPPSKHAFGIKRDDGLEILVHIGLDTVELNGEGFKLLAHEGDRVKIGAPIIRLDMKFLKTKKLDLTTIVVITNAEGKSFSKEKLDETVYPSDVIIKP